MKKIKVFSCILCLVLCLCCGCNNKTKENADGQENKSSQSEANKNNTSGQVDEKSAIVVNKDKNTIKGRYGVPDGYERVKVQEKSFGEFLRNSKLEKYGEKVKYYDGRIKDKDNVYDSVFAVDIGDKDLHQCADAVMLLRAEYLYQNQKYDEISFNFVGGFKAEYKMWRQGYRINVGQRNCSYYKGAKPDNSYSTFRKYMDLVFAYSSTLSLDKELKSVNVGDIQIGDVFIEGGSPGHCVIVVDMAQNKTTGEKIFMIAQSYMPAQQTQLLINPNDESLSPWYSLNFGDTLNTPEWTFSSNQLKRF